MYICLSTQGPINGERSNIEGRTTLNLLLYKIKTILNSYHILISNFVLITLIL